MEESEKRVLSQFRGRLANEIVVTASFLSAFCERSVLDDEMTKIVKSEDTYVAKAHKLLELLPKRGPKAFSTLLEILEITNPWLAEKMKSALYEERNREAKLKISSSVSESASIEGYGASSRQTLDNDLRATAHRFVKSSLQHLTESEQRNTEQWLGEELQRERRKQQFRIPNTIRRHPEEFQSCKEVQTEMKGIEIQELCEDLMIQLHGVQFTEVNTDLSFKMLQKQISELVSRVQKMDFLFIQCLEKFEDVDKYALPVPDLIERSMMRQKELVRALMDDRRKIQRLTEDRDNLDRHIRRLEEEFEKLMKQQSQKVVHPHQMYLKKRKELQERYTMSVTKERSRKVSADASLGRSHGSSTSPGRSHGASASPGRSHGASASPSRSHGVHLDGHTGHHSRHHSHHHPALSEAQVAEDIEDQHHAKSLGDLQRHGESQSDDRQNHHAQSLSDSHHHARSQPEQRDHHHHAHFLTEDDPLQTLVENAANEDDPQHDDPSHLNGAEDGTHDSQADDINEAVDKPVSSSPKHRVRFSTQTSRPGTGVNGNARRRHGTAKAVTRGSSGRLSFTSGKK